MKRCERRHLSSPSYVKVNVDAGFFEKSLETGIYMVIHDEAGDLIACRTVVTPIFMKIDDGEAWGVFETIRWAKNLGYSKI
ncbi:hypothetical protein ACS0TY_024860 [Phlomoides rotata]